MRLAGPIMLAALAVALAGCGGGGGETSSAGATTAAAPATTTVDVRIEGGRPAGGIVRATVKKGDRVVLVVHSDVADEVHLHGYDLSVDVEAGGTARIEFTARIPGVFEAELEHEGLQIVELTVR